MRLARAVSLVTLLLAGTTGLVSAQGFQLNEIGTCAMTRGSAATGATCGDPSVIFWNPAATVSIPGWSAYAGAAAISVSASFTADTTGRVFDADTPVELPVHLFVNYTAPTGRWAVGVGAYVPYGLPSKWQDDFPGRFTALEASLQTVYVQPNFAYRFAPGWSIGGGPVLGYSRVELQQSIDLAQQVAPASSGGTIVTFGMLGVPARTEFARAKLKGSATALGFNVGLHGTLTPNLEFGVRYLSQLTFDYDDADASFSQVPTGLVIPAGNPLGVPAGTKLDDVLAGQFAAGEPLSARKVATRIKHPSQLQADLGYTGFTNTVLSAGVSWTKFSSFDKLPVDFQGSNPPPDRELVEDYNDAWSIRTGIEHAFAIGIKGRAGFNYIHTPAPDITVTPLLPDMNRKNYTIGVGLPLSPRYTLDAGYLRVDTDGRRGRIVERSVGTGIAPTTVGGPTAAQLNSGFYTLNANVFSISIRANF